MFDPYYHKVVRSRIIISYTGQFVYDSYNEFHRNHYYNYNNANLKVYNILYILLWVDCNHNTFLSLFFVSVSVSVLVS
jgi:hypothetical protein